MTVATALLAVFPAPLARAADPTTPTVTVAVTGSDGAPISDAWVWLTGTGGSAWGNPEGNGIYSILDVQPGSYTIMASAKDYLDTYYAAAASTWDRSAADTITVADDATSVAADIAMVKGVTVSGTVTIGDRPASWAEVRTDDGRYYASTNDVGTYTLQVPPGEVTLTVSKCLGDWTSTKKVSVTAELDDSVTADVALSEGTGITGSVAVPIGTPTVTVALYRVTGDTEDQIDTRSVYGSGTYAFRSLAPGDYRVRFRSPASLDACVGGASCTTFPVSTDVLTQAGTTALAARAAGTVTGRVLDGSDAPISGVTVTASTANGSVTATTDASGNYQLNHLASGVSWWLSYHKAAFADQSGTAIVTPGSSQALPDVHLVANGALGGTVRGADGTALAGVAVRLESVESGSTAWVGTAADGTYELTALPAGHYRAWIEADGYLEAYHPGVLDDRDAAVIAVSEGVTTTADLTAVKPASLTGTVALPDGTAATGTATLGKLADRYWIRSADIIDGQYAFDGLTAGDYAVAVSVDGYPDQPVSEGAPISVPAATDANAPSLTLVPDPTAVSVTGTLTAGGAGLDGATVGLLADDHTYTADTADGTFALQAPPGTYQVQVSRADTTICGPKHSASCTIEPVTLPADTGASLTLALPELGDLNGTVSGPDGPVSGATVKLTDARGATVATTTTTVDGTYALGWLPPGSDHCTVTAAGLVPHAEPLELVGGSTTHDVDLSGFLTISGAVTVAAGEDADGWAKVFAVDASNTTVAATWLPDLSAGEHHFTLTNLPPGSYRVGVQASGGRWQWYSTTTNAAAGTSIDLTATAADGIALGLPAAPPRVTISGQLIAPAGAILDPDSPPTYPAVTLLNLTSEQSYTATVSATGHYSAGVPAGSYRLSVEASDDLKTSGQSEKVTIDSNRSHDLNLVQGGALAGRVTDAGGLGALATITASGSSWRRTTETDRWGYWRIERVPVGGVTVRADPAGSYVAATATASVSAEQTSTTNLRLAEAGRIVVLVPQVPDLNLTSVTVVVTDGHGAEVARDTAFPGDTTSIGEVPVGDVRVRFEGAGLRTLWWPAATTITDAQPVTVVAAGPPTVVSAPVQAETRADDGRITGTISNPTKLGGSLTITRVATDGTETTTPVSADEGYRLTVPPGDYRLRAAICSGDWVDGGTCLGELRVTWYGGNDSPRTVTVAPGKDVAGVDVPIGGKFAFDVVPCPLIGGSALVGVTLQASEGGVSPVPDAVGWQWLRNGAPIAGATAAAYRVVEADVGARLSVRVTASRDGYLTQATESTPTATVARPVVSPGLVGVGGAGRRPDDRLDAVVSGWPFSASLSYQWLRNGVAIRGMTSNSYVVGQADVGATVSVLVTGSLPGHDPVSVQSAPVGPMLSRLSLTKGTVKISGAAKVSRKLTATLKKWKPSGISYSYRWYRDSKPISGATRSSYRVTKADKRHRIRVRVTAAKLRYWTIVVASAKTAKVR